MIHKYIDNSSSKTLILLHGTGGNEEQLIPLGKIIDKDANILSIRGNINENGLNRYFKRFSLGKYDLNSYDEEIDNLTNSITELSARYNFNINEITIVGFSNGANIALGILQKNPFINNYILLSPDYINKDEGFVNLENKNVFISTADNDPYVNKETMKMLIERLNKNKAFVEVLKTSGHNINDLVVQEMVAWYKKTISL